MSTFEFDPQNIVVNMTGCSCARTWGFLDGNPAKPVEVINAPRSDCPVHGTRQSP